MNPIEFYHAHHTAVTAACVAAVHFAHLAWPRVKLTFFFLRDNGGVSTIASDIWNGRAEPAGKAALLASIKQTAGPEAGAPITGKTETGGTPVLLKTNE